MYVKIISSNLAFRKKSQEPGPYKTSPFMKRNISLIVLACEIAMIVVLHTVKLYQADRKGVDSGNSVSKTIHSIPAGSHFLLLGLK